MEGADAYLRAKVSERDRLALLVFNQTAHATRHFDLGINWTRLSRVTTKTRTKTCLFRSLGKGKK
jgi:hypothetical protein